MSTKSSTLLLAAPLGNTGRDVFHTGSSFHFARATMPSLGDECVRNGRQIVHSRDISVAYQMEHNIEHGSPTFNRTPRTATYARGLERLSEFDCWFCP